MTAPRTSTALRTTPSFVNYLRAGLLFTAGLLTAGCVQPASVELAPNPNADTVVLLHGLGRSASAMSQLAERLEVFGFVATSSKTISAVFCGSTAEHSESSIPSRESYDPDQHTHHFSFTANNCCRAQQKLFGASKRNIRKPSSS